jgi:two-component system response regulator AtoC
MVEREMELLEPVIIGKSQVMQNLKSRIRKVAGTDLNVLISGERGVGKDVVAQALHFMSYRRERPFIKVNCGETPGEFLESELFGYEQETLACTTRLNVGKLKRAHRGTIFLSQIDAVPLPLQAKLLRVLEDYEFTPVDSKRNVKVDCWVLAATNGNLEELVKEGLFREDLYRRLNIIRVLIPPLRERPEDIEPLVYYFAQKISTEAQNQSFKLSDNGIMDMLCQHSWPGNVMELQDTVNRLLRMHDREAIKKELALSGQLSNTVTASRAQVRK